MQVHYCLEYNHDSLYESHGGLDRQIILLAFSSNHFTVVDGGRRCAVRFPRACAAVKNRDTRREGAIVCARWRPCCSSDSSDSCC